MALTRRAVGRALAFGVPAALAVGVGLLIARSLGEGVAHGDAPSLVTRLAGPSPAHAPPPPSLAGLDLAKLTLTGQGARAPLGDPAKKRTAVLTVDPVLQKAADGLMTTHRLPEAAIVLMDVATGKILVWASHVEKGPSRDLCVEAIAPAASVFKLVTASALVEHAGVSPDQRECYSGGEQRITEKDLVADPKKDRWCTTVAGAMGRSINTVFARLASRHLRPAELTEEAHALGFGAPLAFDVAAQPSTITVPEDALGFARTAAGFWNTTLSPLHAAWLSATMARGGEPVRPFIVGSVVEEGEKDPIWVATPAVAERRALKTETAESLTTMMEATVSDGTSYKAFHDAHGTPFLPGIVVAGKTGTLTDAPSQRFYTWFTGFAPSKPLPTPVADARQVAVAVLVVNDPVWSVKANVVAREILRAYFAEAKVPGVTAPAPVVHEPRDDASEPRGRSGPAGGAASTTPGTKHRRQRGS